MSIRTRLPISALALLLGTIPAAARADFLPIKNGSFESPVTAFVTVFVDDWTVEGSPDTGIAGIFNNNSTEVGDPAHITNPVGNQLVFLGTETGNGLTQTVPGAVFEAGTTYTLSAGVAVSYSFPPRPTDAIRLALFYLNPAGQRQYVASSLVFHSPENALTSDMVKYFTAQSEPIGSNASSVGRPVGVEISTVGVIGRFFDLEDVTVQTLRPLPSVQWNLDGGGSWSEAVNWLSPTVPNGAGHTARLGGALLSRDATVTLDGDRTVGTLHFDNPVNSYTVAGPGTLTFDAGQSAASIVVASGHHSISAPIAISQNLNVDSADGSSVSLTEGLNLTGNLVKDGGGTLTLKHIRDGNLEITAGTVAIALNGGSAGASLVNGLSIAPAAALDLADNVLVARNVALDDVQSLVVSGRNGGTWDGPGIQTSAAAPSGLTALAVVANDFGVTSLNGLTVEAGDIFVKYTWNGDTDLNGLVDGDDYFQIDIGFASNTTGWRNGDFDYNGTVDGDDYFLIDSAFARQTGRLGPGPAVVPEPAALGLLLVTGTAASIRRRRCRSAGG